MAEDPLLRVLGLVAEGRLTAEEAAPILAALAGSAPATDGADVPPGADQHPGAGDGRGAATLTIEVRDRGRTVVNLRLPVGVGRFALDRVPGLSGDQVARVRDALRSGVRGPVLVVDDDEGGGVRIGLE
jgi:hypothetical protein